MKTKRRVMTRVEPPWTPTDGRGKRRISTMVDPMKAPAPGNRLPYRRGSVEYCLGTEADHEAVYQTLLHVFHGPDREAFLGALSDPVYRPDQRLLAKVDGRIVSHVHLTERQLRYGSVTIPINGVIWVGTLPEFRGMGFAQNLMRLASKRARDNGVVLQVLTTGMPQFYRPLGWGVCGRQTFAQTMSRNLPQVSDGMIEGRGAFWHVRPWRQVELGDLMALYELQYAHTTGTIVRSEEYWRWMIGRKYAHVIWVACQGETVRGYAFIKDHKVLEIASDPAYPQALRALLGRVRAEALERAYPEVIVSAPERPSGHRRRSDGIGKDHRSGRLRGDGIDVPHPRSRRIPQRASSPNCHAGRSASGCALPLELGICVDDDRWLIHIDGKNSRVEPEKLSRRHLTLTQPALVRLLMGHTSIAAASDEEGFIASTSTALDAARILFQPGADLAQSAR